MSTSTHNTFIPLSVLTLGNSVIRYTDAKIDNIVQLHKLDHYEQDLFSFPWNPWYIKLLRSLLNVRSRSEFYRRQFDTFHKIMEVGNADFLHLLIKYGFLNIKILEDYPVIKFDVAEERRTGIHATGLAFEYRCGTIENFFWTYVPLYHVRLLNKLQNYTCVSTTRMQKVLWGLEAILWTSSSASPHLKVGCLRTFYEFTREPYITSAEVARIVTYIKGSTSDSYLAELCSTFEEYFPESMQDYQPRSLKHLCLCQVRENLNKVGRFPHGLQELKLPQSIKDSLISKTSHVVLRDCKSLFRYSEYDYFCIVPYTYIFQDSQSCQEWWNP